jgi:peptide/nickel transport system ATP-binding protein
VLVADEPTTALDVTIQAQILDLMKCLVAERGTGIVLITHDMGVVADIADRVAVMYAGRIAEIAPAGELFARPAHPYTALLLGSVPRRDLKPKEFLTIIEGSVPSAAEFGAGCRFADRCPLVGDRCRIEVPPLIEREAGHRAACWHTDRVAELIGFAA